MSVSEFTYIIDEKAIDPVVVNQVYQIAQNIIAKEFQQNAVQGNDNTLNTGDTSFNKIEEIQTKIDNTNAKLDQVVQGIDDINGGLNQEKTNINTKIDFNLYLNIAFTLLSIGLAFKYKKEIHSKITSIFSNKTTTSTKIEINKKE